MLSSSSNTLFHDEPDNALAKERRLLRGVLLRGAISFELGAQCKVIKVVYMGVLIVASILLSLHLLSCIFSNLVLGVRVHAAI